MCGGCGGKGRSDGKDIISEHIGTKNDCDYNTNDCDFLVFSFPSPPNRVRFRANLAKQAKSTDEYL